MKLLDRIAINSLVKTFTNFILAILKIFAPNKSDIAEPNKKRRPVLDLIKKILHKE